MQQENILYNLNFHQLCDALNLGVLQTEPAKISGGLLHRMYRLETDQGIFAVKALNPEILQRSAALDNFVASEKIVNLAKYQGMPAVPARIINGTAIHTLGGQNYLVFPWIEGMSLRPEEITPAHCKKIGKVLAKLHNMDFSSVELGNMDDNTLRPVDWQKYLDMGVEYEAEWTSLLAQNIENLYKWCELVNPASDYIRADMLISHRDLDAKNVLWHAGEPIVIDWESAGFINPMVELAETALNWGGYNEMSLEKDKFMVLIAGYKTHRSVIKTDWQKVLENNFSGKMEWLEYNLLRSLDMRTADSAERQLGTEEVLKTIPRIKYYADMLPMAVKWLG